jgi:hypothetical protein
MNGTFKVSPVWTRGRFLGIIGSLFALQIGLICLFGARSEKPGPELAPGTRFRAMRGLMSRDDLMRLFFISDPAAFPLPSHNGFSGRAWMNQPPPQYQPANQLEAPLWLALDPSRLGTGFANLDEAAGTSPLTLAPLEIRQTEPPPPFLTPQTVPTQSVFRIEGELANRLIAPPPALHAWPSPAAKLLANSVVQIAVNRTGDVQTARLLARCGSAEADADALAKTWALRFRPSADAPTLWAQAIFEWQTTFPAQAGALP